MLALAVVAGPTVVSVVAACVSVLVTFPETLVSVVAARVVVLVTLPVVTGISGLTLGRRLAEKVTPGASEVVVGGLEEALSVEVEFAGRVEGFTGTGAVAGVEAGREDGRGVVEAGLDKGTVGAGVLDDLNVEGDISYWIGWMR